MTTGNHETEVHAHAVETLFQVFDEMSEGAMSVDRNARIVWINDKYRFLLGVGDAENVLGREVETVIPESLMRRVVETGKPIPVDIMRFGERHFVVSRMPLHGADGNVIGAIGFVLFDRLDYLKPLISKFESLRDRLSSAEAELASQRRTRFSIANIVGNSPQMVDIRRQARKLAQATSPVLLQGETGTGKELLAQSIHAASARSERPFVAVNMAAVPETLMETEFFGVAPGAFTGADRRGRKGKFEIADGGTLFMDEIADMPAQMQVKLLRVLEDQSIEPVGSNEVRKVDVRLMAATSQDLARNVEKGSFRKDLFYRLNVLQVRIPPLRERLIDLRPLAEVLSEKIAQSTGQAASELDSNGLLVLQEHSWPGNVRELRNVLERAVLQAEADVLGAAEISAVLDGETGAPVFEDGIPITGLPTLPQRISNLEREAIMDAMRSTGGKKAPAARLLGISRSTLYEKLDEHKLSDFKA